MAFFRSFVAVFLLLCAPLLGACAKEKSIYTVYTVLAEMAETDADALSVGDDLTDACAKEPLGEVIALSREAALSEDAYGAYEKEGRVWVKLTVACEARQAADGLQTKSVTLRAGERLYFLARTRFEGVCVRVRTVAEGLEK